MSSHDFTKNRSRGSGFALGPACLLRNPSPPQRSALVSAPSIHLRLCVCVLLNYVQVLSRQCTARRVRAVPCRPTPLTHFGRDLVRFCVCFFSTFLSLPPSLVCTVFRRLFVSLSAPYSDSLRSLLCRGFSVPMESGNTCLQRRVLIRPFFPLRLCWCRSLSFTCLHGMCGRAWKRHVERVGVGVGFLYKARSDPNSTSNAFDQLNSEQRNATFDKNDSAFLHTNKQLRTVRKTSFLRKRNV